VKWFSDVRGYGFIESAGKDFFVHFRDIVGTGYRTLEEGQLVEFTIVQSAKRGAGCCRSGGGAQQGLEGHICNQSAIRSVVPEPIPPIAAAAAGCRRMAKPVNFDSIDAIRKSGHERFCNHLCSPSVQVLRSTRPARRLPDIAIKHGTPRFSE
jgi:CspA family cold shock protein